MTTPCDTRGTTYSRWARLRWMRARGLRVLFAMSAAFALCLSPMLARAQYDEIELLRWSTPWLGSRDAVERGYLWNLAELLARNGGPREYALAAHVRAMAGVRDVRIGGGLSVIDAKTQRWLSDAERMGRSDPVVQVLLLHRFSDGDPTYRLEDTVRRWRENDYDNLAPLLASGAPTETLPIDQLLALARSTTRADFYFDDIVRPMIRAVKDEPPPETLLASRFGDAQGTPEALGAQLGTTIWAKSADVAFSALVNACRGRALEATPRRRADCRHVARLLSDESDTLLAHLIGVNMRLRNFANKDELRAAVIDYRRYHWQAQQWEAVQARDRVESARSFAYILKDERDITEIAIMRRMLSDAGVRLEPPASFVAPMPN
jgi:hypothetical protein